MIRAHESTTNVPGGRNVRDISRGIHELDPDIAPLTAVISKGATKKKVAENPKFEWNERGNAPKADQVNDAGGVLAADTEITVDNADRFGVYDLVKNPRTNEVVRVTAVNTGTDVITVSRSVGPTAAAAMNDNDDLFIIGNAWAEGAPKGTPRQHVETTPYNFTEIFRHHFGRTRTQEKSKTYSGETRTDLRMAKAREHKIDIENAFLFGERFEDASDTNMPVRGTGGLTFWLTANTLDAGGTLTEAELETWLESVFQHTAGSATRLFLASPKIISVLDQLAAGRLQTVSDRNVTYGLSLKSWLTSHGELIIANHKGLVNGAGGFGYKGYGFAIDPTKLAYRYFTDSDSKLNENIQDNGDDRWTDEYLSEVGLELHNPEVHGLIYGVTG